MKYNPQTKTLSIDIKDADAATAYLKSAIHYLRTTGGHPTAGNVEVIGPASTGEYCIINAAQALGIDLGATCPGKLDVTDFA